MKNNDIKELAIALATSETEDEVVKVLTKANLWNDKNCWKEVDESSGNWSTIGNQQSAPDTALVEKVINSVDAVLMKECMKEGLDPQTKEAPRSIADAQKKYFHILNGRLSSIDAKLRSELASNVLLIATGGKSNPSYTIVDLGEGQEPKRFPNTFLSLNRGNKSKVQFVQGKFGMGGTGVFRFGSPKHNLQLIISRRDPGIKDGSTDQWGVTVTRRIPPTGQMRSSIFTYLAPNNEVLSFPAPSLPLLPSEYPNPYGNPLTNGTFIKIYEYDLTGYKTNITLDLYNRLSLLMPGIALPIRMIERRKGYTAHSYETTLAGLSVRLDEDKRENLEDGFPNSGELKVGGQKMDFLLYAFKKGRREKYAKSEGIIFTINGQTHGSLSKSFFDRRNVGMSYLSDSVLITIDCSKIDRDVQEKLFMNSRDRLAGGALQNEIEKQLEDLVKNHPGLKALREKRRREDIEDKLQDSKPLADILQDIIKRSPSLSNLFLQGVRIQNPFKLSGVKEKDDFKGNKFPTFFKPARKYDEDSPKPCPINAKFRIQFETDAENDYFNRDMDPGEVSLKINESVIEHYSLNLWNGLATLTLNLPEGVKMGDTICFQTNVTDSTRVEPLMSEFCVVVSDPKKKSDGGGGGGGRKKPPNNEPGEDRKDSSALDIPNALEVRRVDWEKHNFNEKSALKVISAGEGNGYDFYINMDNVYLQMEIKGDIKSSPELTEARFKYGMVLIGISLLDYDNKKSSKIDSDEIPSIYDEIAMLSEAISPTLLPMISSLSELGGEV